MTEDFYKEQVDKEEKLKEEDLKKIIKENNELLNRLVETTNSKPLKLKKLGKVQRKKGYVNYLFIRTNGNMESLKVPVDEMTTFFEKTPRLARPEEILNYNGSPTIIQPEWSSKPFSMIDNYNKTVKEKYLSAGYRLLALRAEQGNIKGKKKMSGAVIIFIIVVMLVVGYLLLF